MLLSRFSGLLVIALIAGCAGLRQVSAPPAIVVSDRLAAYEDVVEALAARLQSATVHRLDGDPRKAQALIAELRHTPDVPVVAIGSLATRAAVALRDRRVVYCQDFTAERAAAAPGIARGVSAVPPAYKQLQAWKMIDPTLERVTLVSGAGMDAFVHEARAAARRLDIALDYVDVRSDRELLYVVKRLDATVQGVWFAPDNRVLSVTALRETLAHNLRHGRQSLVFSPQLLGLGGMISIESDPDDIAERVLEQLRAGGDAPTVAPLQRARARINIEIAKQLGLSVPAAMQGGRYVF